jgi:BirA family biotin operon repressor/biotin-[acetyl-CoA-carboxylase] ligase
MLHTLNLRLSVEDLGYIIQHADDRAIFVDPDQLPLLERLGDAVVVGFGVNLADHPDETARPAISLGALGSAPDPARFLDALAASFARWLERWREEGLAPVRQRWLAAAHPRGTALSTHTASGAWVEGLFDGLDESGALCLRIADGSVQVIHAGDVFLI